MTKFSTLRFHQFTQTKLELSVYGLASTIFDFLVVRALLMCLYLGILDVCCLLASFSHLTWQTLLEIIVDTMTVELISTCGDACMPNIVPFGAHTPELNA